MHLPHTCNSQASTNNWHWHASNPHHRRYTHCCNHVQHTCDWYSIAIVYASCHFSSQSFVPMDQYPFVPRRSRRVSCHFSSHSFVPMDPYPFVPRRSRRVRHKSPRPSTVLKYIRILKRLPSWRRYPYFSYILHYWPALIAYMKPQLRWHDAILLALFDSDSEYFDSDSE